MVFKIGNTLQLKHIGCKIEGCDGEHAGLGYCGKHYQRHRRLGSLNLPMRPESKKKHHLWTIWKGMRARCNNPNAPMYHLYGGKGVRLSPEWNDFWQFVKDIGPRPSLRHSVDRIDSNGNYEARNCRWATPKEQAANSSKPRIIEHNGERLNVSEWARKLGIHSTGMHYRIRKHGVAKAIEMGSSRSLTTPQTQDAA